MIVDTDAVTVADPDELLPADPDTDLSRVMREALRVSSGERQVPQSELALSADRLDPKINSIHAHD
ncbi:hypothetical protein HYW94_01255 [Candidatus Uhrbacteria bacterium]|nr:hypothetical protein [Candidatus Uhrbacteria bacterium]